MLNGLQVDENASERHQLLSEKKNTAMGDSSKRLSYYGPRPRGPAGAALTRQAAFRTTKRRHYIWREAFRGGGFLAFFRWLLNGYSPIMEVEQTDEEIQGNLTSLARMLVLLREYLDRFGMPDDGGPKDQEYVLREVTKDLYAGGVPIWGLETGMQLAAEGLTGKRGVEFFILPRKAFIFAPSSGATSMFRMTRGFDMQRLNAVEAVMVRMASFATNTGGIASLPARMPSPGELNRAFASSERSFLDGYGDREEIAVEILELAFESEGLFFYINSVQHQREAAASPTKSSKGNNAAADISLQVDKEPKEEVNDVENSASAFWTVEPEVSELFSRLATMEAVAAIDKFDAERKKLYPSWALLLFRFLSSAGACAFWFSGSWVDIVVGGGCGVLVGLIANLTILTREERLIFEALAAFAVGVVAGLITVFWPDHSCFRAIALSGVLDLLQGFRVVYAIIELMSRQTVSGTADFFEGMLFTAIVAAFLQFGKVAVRSFGNNADVISQCDTAIAQAWYVLWVPVASFSWNALFNPEYADLAWMTFHGILAFAVSYAFDQTAMSSESKLFISASIVTFSSGIVSRFSGRQAIGNAVAGLYPLLPGAYLVTNFFQLQSLDWLGTVFFRAGAIGLGAWTGTLLCSPTMFGATKGLFQNKLTANSTRPVSAFQASIHRDQNVRKNGTGAMLFF